MRLPDKRCRTESAGPGHGECLDGQRDTARGRVAVAPLRDQSQPRKLLRELAAEIRTSRELEAVPHGPPRGTG